MKGDYKGFYTEFTVSEPIPLGPPVRVLATATMHGEDTSRHHVIK